MKSPLLSQKQRRNSEDTVRQTPVQRDQQSPASQISDRVLQILHPVIFGQSDAQVRPIKDNAISVNGSSSNYTWIHIPSRKFVTIKYSKEDRNFWSKITNSKVTWKHFEITLYFHRMNFIQRLWKIISQEFLHTHVHESIRTNTFCYFEKVNVYIKSKYLTQCDTL